MPLSFLLWARFGAMLTALTYVGRENQLHVASVCAEVAKLPLGPASQTEVSYG